MNFGPERGAVERVTRCLPPLRSEPSSIPSQDSEPPLIPLSSHHIPTFTFHSFNIHIPVASMLDEEGKPFLDGIGESHRYKEASTASPEHNRPMRISLVANVVLLAVCVLLSGTVFFLSERTRILDTSQPKLAEPYCTACIPESLGPCC